LLILFGFNHFLLIRLITAAIRNGIANWIGLWCWTLHWCLTRSGSLLIFGLANSGCTVSTCRIDLPIPVFLIGTRHARSDLFSHPVSWLFP
jgi:hypothetical protein